jgi:hypothetical protein
MLVVVDAWGYVPAVIAFVPIVLPIIYAPVAPVVHLRMELDAPTAL